MSRFVFAVLMLALASGCTVSLSPISEPPPAKHAELSENARTLTLSRGVAFGVECYDNCNGQCTNVTVTSGDEDVVFVRNAFHQTEVEHYDAWHNPNAFVVAAKKAGATTVTVKDDCATTVYAVTVPEDTP